MSEVRSYRDLIAWQKAMDVVADVYEMTRDWPREELYGLTSQTGRAAVSIPANIAEGYGRDSTGAYLSFLRIARGSLRELETLLLVAQRAGVDSDQRTDALLARADELGRVLYGLIKKLETPDA